MEHHPEKIWLNPAHTGQAETVTKIFMAGGESANFGSVTLIDDSRFFVILGEDVLSRSRPFLHQYCVFFKNEIDSLLTTLFHGSILYQNPEKHHPKWMFLELAKASSERVSFAVRIIQKSR